MCTTCSQATHTQPVYNYMYAATYVCFSCSLFCAAMLECNLGITDAILHLSITSQYQMKTNALRITKVSLRELWFSDTICHTLSPKETLFTRVSSETAVGNKQLCCQKEAVRWFLSVSSQLQQYKMSSRVFYCQLRRLQIYHCVQLNALFCCLWRNVEASCHKYFVVFSRNQHHRLLPAMCHTQLVAGRWSSGDHVDNTWPVAALTAGIEARFRLRIAISAYPTCIRRPHQGGSRHNIAMPFGVEKLEWCGYPMVKKF